jgi:hypothetical protein
MTYAHYSTAVVEPGGRADSGEPTTTSSTGSHGPRHLTCASADRRRRAQEPSSYVGEHFPSTEAAYRPLRPRSTFPPAPGTRLTARRRIAMAVVRSPFGSGSKGRPISWLVRQVNPSCGGGPSRPRLRHLPRKPIRRVLGLVLPGSTSGRWSYPTGPRRSCRGSGRATPASPRATLHRLAVYGKRNISAPATTPSRDETYDLGGIRPSSVQSLHPQRFWEIYDRPAYKAARAALDPNDSSRTSRQAGPRD